MSETGIRDSATTAIVNTLLELGKRLRKRQEGKEKLPEAQVQEALEKEVEKMLQDKTIVDAINPLLRMRGAFQPYNLCY